MTFVLTITSPDGLTTRTLTAAQTAATTFDGERNGEDGYGAASVKIPAGHDDLTAIGFGDIVTATFEDVLQYKGSVYNLSRAWDGATPTLTLSCQGIAKRAYQVETLRETVYSPAIDRAAAWQEFADLAFATEMPDLVLLSTTTGFNTERVEGTYKTFRDIVQQLREGYEDKIVTGGDVDPITGDDRLFIRPAASSATYTFPIPDDAENPRTRGLSGGGSIDGLFNRLRIRGGSPLLPQYWANGRMIRLTGDPATGRTADGLDISAGGNGAGEVTALAYVPIPGTGPGNELHLTVNASPTNPIVISPSGAGGGIELAIKGEPLRLEIDRISGTAPYRVELEYFDANGKRVLLLQEASVTTLVSLTPPATAVRATARLILTDDGTAVIRAFSLRNAAAPTGEYLQDGPYTILLDSDDARLEDYNISAAAAGSKAAYTAGVSQATSVSAEYIVTEIGALAYAAEWFNRHAVPMWDPSFCRLDDSTPYWPGAGVALTGVQGTALMGDQAYLPIATVRLQHPASGGLYEQRISLKKPEVANTSGLARAQKALVRGMMTQTSATAPSVTAAAAGTPGGGKGAGTGVPDGFRPPRRFDDPQVFDPPALTVDEHGTVTAVGPSATVADLQDQIDNIEAGIVKTGFNVTVLSVDPDTGTPSAGPIQTDDDAQTQWVAQFRGSFTGYTIAAKSLAGSAISETAILTLEKNGLAFGTAEATWADITDGANLEIAGTTASDTILTGWEVDFSEGDEFRVVLAAASGSADRLEIFLSCTVANAYAA